MEATPEPRLPFVRLAALTVGALAIHGYHLGVEDAEIHIPAAKKLLDPSLYPYATEFFMSHARLSLFDPLLAWTAQLTHIPIDLTISLWYVTSLFFLLAAGWMLATISFETARARWAAVLAMTAALAMPVANTGLLLVDPYLTPRSFTTPLTLFALAFLLRRRYAFAALATLATVAFHLQMGVYLLLLAGMTWLAGKYLSVVRQRVSNPAFVFGLLPIGFQLIPAQQPYREALYARDFFFLSNWSWYHWLGMLAPLAILAWFWKGKLRGTTPEFRRLSFALIPFGLLSILIAAIFTSTHNLDVFACLQPLRCFHLVTLVFVLFLGGIIGEYAAKGRSWVLAAVFLPLAAGMFVVAQQTYPFSPHIELPWAKTSSNSWVNALLWVRDNTPEDAVFAVDSRYFKGEGVDVHGFRAISERSTLADYYKDGGVVAMFPHLAVEWKQMSDATYDLNHFSSADFTRLAGQYPVTWTVIHGPAPDGMTCPYQQRDYAVCRISGVWNSAPALAVVSRQPTGKHISSAQ